MRTADRMADSASNEIASTGPTRLMILLQRPPKFRPYRDLVQSYMSRRRPGELGEAVLRETRLLAGHLIVIPGFNAAVFVETLIDRLNRVYLNPDSVEFTAIMRVNRLNAVREILYYAAERAGGELAQMLDDLMSDFDPDKEPASQEARRAHAVAYAIVNIATLHFAYNAALSGELRKAFRIREQRRVVYGILLAVAAVAVFVCLRYPATLQGLAHAVAFVLLVPGFAYTWVMVKGLQDGTPTPWKRYFLWLALIGAGFLLLKL